MSVFTDSSFLSCNGKTQIHVRRCTPVGRIIGVVQIAHGIAEHIERYDDFAAFLAENGFLVVGNDHLGHGKSINDESDLGFFAENGGWQLVVGDMRKLFEATHAEFPDVPYFLFGHSMGSFLSRTYIIKYPKGLDGVILCGTGQQTPPIVASGKLLARLVRRDGARKKSDLINSVAFGSYNNRIKPRRTDFDWLSRDSAVVDRYIADPLCGFIPSVDLFLNMLEGIEFIGAPKNISRMEQSLPVFLISGEEDPVGEYGKGVMRVYKAFLDAGMTDVTMKLYPDCRHELLNELNRDEVMADILGWLKTRLPQPAE